MEVLSVELVERAEPVDLGVDLLDLLRVALELQVGVLAVLLDESEFLEVRLLKLLLLENFLESQID